jgi:hypothetical protein
VGRDASGRFAPGNRFGPGNPYARQVAALRKALAECATAEEVRAVGRMLLLRALEGDLAAAKLFLTYAVGKPPAVDPDTLDQQEFEIFRQTPVVGEDVDHIARGLPADWAVHVLRHVVPCRTATLMNQLEGVMGQKAEQQAKQEERKATKAERKAARKARREAEKAARQAQKAETGPVPGTESNGSDGPRPVATAESNGPVGLRVSTPPESNGPEGAKRAEPTESNGPDGGSRRPRPSRKGGRRRRKGR